MLLTEQKSASLLFLVPEILIQNSGNKNDILFRIWYGRLLKQARKEQAVLYSCYAYNRTNNYSFHLTIIASRYYSVISGGPQNTKYKTLCYQC